MSSAYKMLGPFFLIVGLVLFVPPSANGTKNSNAMLTRSESPLASLWRESALRTLACSQLHQPPWFLSPPPCRRGRSRDWSSSAEVVNTPRRPEIVLNITEGRAILRP
ncbi:hypothetical protein DFJ73DRAFT_860900 [Zopfochytrium polystomum]|nr:hypothetical protein DFJ73DRAFT_860900 [Zopfochytrium polystomum]